MAKILLVEYNKQEEKNNIHVRGSSLTTKITYSARLGLKRVSGLKKNINFCVCLVLSLGLGNSDI